MHYAVQVHTAVSQVISENDLVLTFKPRGAEDTIDIVAPTGGRVSELPAAADRNVAGDAYILAIDPE